MFVNEPMLDVLLRGVILTALAMSWVVLLVRINGLRSFSKMTNFDFVMTIAVGSMLAGASQSTSWTAFAQTFVAMAMLFVVQYSTARLRSASPTFSRVVQNVPVVLMRDGQILEEALAETRVAKGDLIAKLREANVLDFSEVRAVVLETTGDISVLHGQKSVDELLQGTRRVDR
ncbi:YetF domain-containing protein [Guyparkeria halopsychrophila]|uniref:DUF421 domain-containing protein n=1 Tax=Guyparkeria halopsychrophila TaxID=3139421 RepID=UPI0037C994CF